MQISLECIAPLAVNVTRFSPILKSKDYTAIPSLICRLSDESIWTKSTLIRAFFEFRDLIPERPWDLDRSATHTHTLTPHLDTFTFRAFSGRVYP